MKFNQITNEDDLLPLDRIIELLKLQNNVFEALAEIRNTNSLNGYTVINKYTENQIKQHYKNNQNHVKVDSNTSNYKQEKAKSNYNPYRELQKGYMKLGGNNMKIGNNGQGRNYSVEGTEYDPMDFAKMLEKMIKEVESEHGKEDKPKENLNNFAESWKNAKDKNNFKENKINSELER